MKVAITGAQGFTGRFLCEALKKRGHQPHPVKSNLTDRTTLLEEIGSTPFDACVHLAAIASVTHANENAFYEVNVVGTTNLLAAISAKNPSVRKILIASSANVYGNTDQSPISETVAPAPVNHYAASKLAMEYMAKTYGDRLPIVLARPFNYTGPGQSDDFIVPKIVHAFQRKDRQLALGNLDVSREFNDVRTVCDIYCAILAHAPPGETFNVCTGVTYSLQSILSLASALSNHQLSIEFNAQLARKNEIKTLCGNPEKLQRFLKAHALTITPIPLEQTISDMLKA